MKKRRIIVVVLLFALVLVSAIVAAALWMHESNVRRAGQLCREAERAPTLRERARFLDKAEPYRRKVRMFFDYSVYCRHAESDLKLLIY